MFCFDRAWRGSPPGAVRGRVVAQLLPVPRVHRDGALQAGGLPGEPHQPALLQCRGVPWWAGHKETSGQTLPLAAGEFQSGANGRVIYLVKINY